MDFSALLNEKQLEAVQCTEGPLLIIAGAGSGKTRVLTHRIAYLMQEKGVSPWNIMAITFTNKAATEMRERVNSIAGFGAEAVWVSTFHSACARILRRFIDRLGYSSSFSIYDTDDTKQLLKTIVSDMKIDSKKYPPKRFQYIISSAKNSMISVRNMEEDACNPEDEMNAKVYRAYEEAMQRNNALDFDDLLIKTVELFEREVEVLDSYQERLRYIMVDEYQDTNAVQFKLIELLASKYRNLCVVGDDDQSIYKFRGADIRNILDFEKTFKNAKIVKLEQNYRSTGNILNGANSVIKNNTQRKEKTLWTARESGTPIYKHHYQSAQDEARGVVGEIEKRAAGEKYNSFAILYRTNAQSRLFEEQLIYHNIPYRIVGGTNFYSRKEIKDVLAYLKTIENGQDELAVRRIINIPKRGIGDRSIEKVRDFAEEEGISFFDAICRAKEVNSLGRTAVKIEHFALFIRSFRSFANELTVPELIKKLLEETGYKEALLAENSQESLDRLANIDELISKSEHYQESAQEPTLGGFLQEVALVADIDSFEEDADRVCLMTVHSAKGLEFDNVYLVGMEDGLFPGFSSIFDPDETELQEERRLFYVGMTRARNTLKLTSAQMRMMRGETEFHRISRFLEEVDPSCIKDESDWEMRRFEKQEAVEKKNGSFFSGEGTRKSSGTLPFGKSFNMEQFKLQKADSLDYKEGDRISHKKFGEGTVLEIKDGARDYEVTVEFDDFGRKRMFAAFAKLKKI